MIIILGACFNQVLGPQEFEAGQASCLLKLELTVAQRDAEAQERSVFNTKYTGLG